MEMSEKIYNSAKKFAHKIIDITTKHKRNDKTTYTGSSHTFLNTGTIFNYIRNRNYMSPVITRSHLAYSTSTYFLITDNPMEYTSYELMDIPEYDPEVNFQLSTIMDNQKLYEYYVKCILHFNDFRGACYKKLHINTLNALQKHITAIDEKNWR